ncbi:hypothetical protein AB9F39_39630, partial [Rhizobium leguminosarum]
STCSTERSIFSARNTGSGFSSAHVDLAGPITEPQPNVAAFDVSDDQLTRLRDFISDSFVREEGAVVTIADAGYGE